MKSSLFTFLILPYTPLFTSQLTRKCGKKWGALLCHYVKIIWLHFNDCNRLKNNWAACNFFSYSYWNTYNVQWMSEKGKLIQCHYLGLLWFWQEFRCKLFIPLSWLNALLHKLKAWILRNQPSSDFRLTSMECNLVF